MATTKARTTTTKKAAPAPAAAAAEIKKLTDAVSELTKQVESLKKDVCQCQEMCKAPAPAVGGEDAAVRTALANTLRGYSMEKALRRAGIIK